MTVFLSSYLNGVDKKGRVSVPASFRTEMATQSRQTIVVYAAPNSSSGGEGQQQEDGRYLYAWAYDDFVKLAEKIQQLPALSPVRQRLARTILAAARPLNFDEGGRIMLPENLIKLAGIGEEAMFAGEGEYFTIWNPKRFDRQMAADAASSEADLAELATLWK